MSLNSYKKINIIEKTTNYLMVSSKDYNPNCKIKIKILLIITSRGTKKP